MGLLDIPAGLGRIQYLPKLGRDYVEHVPLDTLHFELSERPYGCHEEPVEQSSCASICAECVLNLHHAKLPPCNSADASDPDDVQWY